MNKIVIEVTSNGWETAVTINGKEYKEKMIYRKKYMTL